MAKVRIRCGFSAEIAGDFDGEVDVEIKPGMTKDAIAEEAESELQGIIETALNNGRYDEIEVNDVTNVSLDEVRVLACPRCKGKGYLFSIVAETDGLLKVGPCPECQRVPTPKDAIELVKELVEETEEDE